MDTAIRDRRGSARRCARSSPRSWSASTTSGWRWTITGIDVDDELNRAHVFFDSLEGEEGDAEIVEALNRHRVRLQGAIADQIRAKKTPILDFRPDIALRSAERIDDILREDRKRHPDRTADGAGDGQA